MANGAPRFSIGGHVTDESMAETSTAGTYSGTWSPANDLHDGTHTVTVTLGGTRANAGQITVDTKDPSVTGNRTGSGYDRIKRCHDYHFGYRYGHHRCNRYGRCLRCWIQKPPVRLR